MFNPIRLRLHHSRFLATLIVTPFLLGMLLMSWLPAPLWLSLTTILINGTVLIYCLHHYALLTNNRAVVGLNIETDQCTLALRSGAMLQVQIDAASLLTRWICILHCRDATHRQRRHTLFLCRWNVHSLDQLRRLRVRLRFAPPDHPRTELN